jgi:hypothetical protein
MKSFSFLKKSEKINEAKKNYDSKVKDELDQTEEKRVFLFPNNRYSVF